LELEKESAISRQLRRGKASTRRQFFICGKLGRVAKQLGISESNDIRKGNHAVGCGDLLTDRILFDIGELNDHEEFRRLYGVEAPEALNIECTSIIDVINKRASILAEDEEVWLADAELEVSFQVVLEFARTASTAELEKFEEDKTGITDVAKAWLKIMDCPYPPPPMPASYLNK